MSNWQKVSLNILIIIAITRYLPAFSEETLILIYEFLVLLIMFALIAGSCFFIALAWQKKEK